MCVFTRAYVFCVWVLSLIFVPFTDIDFDFDSLSLFIAHLQWATWAQHRMRFFRKNVGCKILILCLTRPPVHVILCFRAPLLTSTLRTAWRHTLTNRLFANFHLLTTSTSVQIAQHVCYNCCLCRVPLALVLHLFFLCARPFSLLPPTPLQITGSAVQALFPYPRVVLTQYMNDLWSFSRYVHTRKGRVTCSTKTHFGFS